MCLRLSTSCLTLMERPRSTVPSEEAAVPGGTGGGALSLAGEAGERVSIAFESLPDGEGRGAEPRRFDPPVSSSEEVPGSVGACSSSLVPGSRLSGAGLSRAGPLNIEAFGVGEPFGSRAVRYKCTEIGCCADACWPQCGVRR